MTDANVELTAQGLPPPHILCGFDTFRQTLVTTLGDPKSVSQSDTSVVLVADAPWGFAFKVFSQYKSRPAVIMTDNPCPEYWDDLWDLKPLVLMESVALV